MTRFIHDQFAKQYLSELLSPLGKVESSKDIHPESRQIDLLFTPSSSNAEERKNLGLLGKLTLTPALFEPFRNPIAANDIRTCAIKLFVVLAELEREAKRTNTPLNETNLPQLWILTPTASSSLLKSFRCVQSSDKKKQGIYVAGTGWKTAIVVIHQLPKTPETLWLRLLGKGRVQERAIRELEALPREDRRRENILKLVKQLVSLLTKRQAREQDLDRDDEELIMTLTQMYEEAMADIRQQAKEEGREEGREEGTKLGQKQATVRLINNLLRVRFGEVDEELAAIIEAIAARPSEEFTPLLLQLSREELLARFATEQEPE